MRRSSTRPPTIPSRSVAIALVAVAACVTACVAACGAPQTVGPVAVDLVQATPPPPPPPASPPPAPEERLPAREDALARGRILADGWSEARYDDAKRAAWLRDAGVDEATVRGLLASVAKPCLAERDQAAAPCKDAQSFEADAGKVIAGLVGVLAEVADPVSGGATARLLVRLDARGLWSADLAVHQILERRADASPGPCAPPSAAEVATARAALADFAVATPPARWPTAAELDELAYFQAAIGQAAPEVGHHLEDTTAPPLPPGHPDLAARTALREEMHEALLDGDLERHVRAADAYLRSLGYPDPLRLHEEGDERWGGAGASFVLRAAARSAEILARYDVAEDYYRRASPWGGMCGTSASSYHEGQIEAVVRVAEPRRGCRAVVAERLFATGHEARGPERLARAGFDVARLYAGALHTLGRDDAAALERALQGLPSRADAALARLGRLGPEAWATRVRAVPGYADTARGAALERLLGLAEHGGDARAGAIDALGRLAEDQGRDPCVPTKDGTFWGMSRSSGERTVHEVMGTCATRIDGATIEGAVRRIGALAVDPDPAVRTAAAVALGRLASPRGRAVLVKLTRDPFDSGGRVCTSRNGGPQVCEPNRPVALAAREALAALAAADKVRAAQRAEQGRK